MTQFELKLCDVQGRLFELSAKNECDSEQFIRGFMESQIAKELDSSYNCKQCFGEEYLFDEILEMFGDTFTEQKEIFESDCIYWMGYLYRYWHYYTGESSKAIYKQAPVETMKRNYMMFHTMAPEMAIEDLKEIGRQKGKNICEKEY